MVSNPRKPTGKSTANADRGGAAPEALRRFVRARAAHFLADPNVTSVGIGYKIVDGKPTDTVAVQFTVHQKAAPEALESLDTPSGAAASAVAPEDGARAGRQYR